VAILIFHQLVEEMLKVLILDTQFLVQVSFFGYRLEPTVRRKQTFGQLQQELRESVDFLGEGRFLSLADRINSVRIEIVHKLLLEDRCQGSAEIRLPPSAYTRGLSQSLMPHTMISG
jgi:hypothetical protein